MERDEAQCVLGVRPGATAHEIEDAHATASQQAHRQLAVAPNEALRRVYRERLKALDEARDALMTAAAQEGPDLTDSQVADLPGIQPSYSDAFDATASGADLEPGQILAGRFEIRARIGSGGMGIVYAAWDRVREEEIALKILLPRLMNQDQAKRRFLNEAKIASALSHTGIVRVYDIQSDGSRYFITMEKLAGRSLRQEIIERRQRNEPFAINEVQRIVRELCEALAYAHAKTVHRDIKPENIWLCPNGRVKIMDFGLARIMTPSQMTATSVSMGTAYYMAPEQLQGAHNADHRADQYSVAAVAYEMLTGRVPSGAFSSPRHWRPELPANVDNAIMGALQQVPADRYPDMNAFSALFSTSIAASRKSAASSRIWLIAGVTAVIVLATVAAVNEIGSRLQEDSVRRETQARIAQGAALAAQREQEAKQLELMRIEEKKRADEAEAALKQKRAAEEAEAAIRQKKAAEEARRKKAAEDAAKKKAKAAVEKPQPPKEPPLMGTLAVTPLKLVLTSKSSADSFSVTVGGQDVPPNQITRAAFAGSYGWMFQVDKSQPGQVTIRPNPDKAETGTYDFIIGAAGSEQTVQVEYRISTMSPTYVKNAGLQLMPFSLDSQYALNTELSLAFKEAPQDVHYDWYFNQSRLFSGIGQTAVTAKLTQPGPLTITVIASVDGKEITRCSMTTTVASN